MVPTANGTDWVQLFSDFHARHRDSKNRKLKFTAVFNAAMDAFIACCDIPLEWRLLAWIWRYSWGHVSDYCVDGINGDSLGQEDCAGFFEVSKQRINDCVQILRQLHFVLPKTGHRLYPVDDPATKALEPDSESPAPNVLSDENPEPESPAPNVLSKGKINPPSGLFQQFCVVWKSASPAYFEELKSAEDTVFRLKKIRLGQYREWRRARTLEPA